MEIETEIVSMRNVHTKWDWYYSIGTHHNISFRMSRDDFKKMNPQVGDTLLITIEKSDEK